MKEMLTCLRPYWKRAILATLAVSVSTLCDLLLPTIMSDILNHGVQANNLNYIVNCCLRMLLISAVGLGTVLAGAKISSDVVAGFCADVRELVFQKVNQMRFEEFGRLGTAALVTRATHDVQTVSWVAAELCGTVITIPVLFFGGVFLAMRKDVMLSLVLLAVVPVIMAAVLRVGKIIIPIWEESDAYVDKQNDIMRQRLRGIRVIRAFNAEETEHSRAAQAIGNMCESFIRSNVTMGIIYPLAMLLLNGAAVLMVYFGAWRIERGTGLTGGDIFAIVQYVALITSGVIMGAYTIIMFPEAKVAAGRIGQVLRAETMAGAGEGQPADLSGDIVFDHVSFCYQGAAEPALRDVCLHITPGQKVAVIGGTGAGKSTLIAMLLGFRMPTAGQVRLSGIPMENLSPFSVRENISCVLQNTAIYSGTIRENVRMGRRNATEAEIWQALEIAQAADFVRGLPEGLDHIIKQSGKNLSGGQKQRLSIARAVLRDAPLYIFDDSFSALDFLTEAHLRRALEQKTAGKTQILVTQRISSAVHCDCIYVMDQGTLVDTGTHEELLRRCGVYREIYASQTGGSTE